MDNNPTAAPTAPLVVARINGRHFRTSDPSKLPEGSELATREQIEVMPIEELNELYSAVAGVPLKKFKAREVAKESVFYQIGKLPEYGGAVKPSAEPSSRPAAGARRSKVPETIELLPVLDEKAIGSLAPQARELLLMMAEIAKENGATSFSSTLLESRLKEPKSAERLRTRQDPVRIMLYYRSKLVDNGFIKISPAVGAVAG
jgi:hypothetical protein